MHIKFFMRVVIEVSKAIRSFLTLPARRTDELLILKIIRKMFMLKKSSQHNGSADKSHFPLGYNR